MQHDDESRHHGEPEGPGSGAPGDAPEAAPAPRGQPGGPPAHGRPPTHAPAGSAAAATAAPPATDAHGDDAHEHHDPPYMIIWGVLLVLTLAEVGYAFLPLGKFWLATGLIVMALWKATLVALYYMHLKWEPRRMWVLAFSPLPLAVILILAVITEF